ncbi:MAG TPA: hypothetical protein VFS27_10710 [Blastocatellia bacterium]|jgi:hypothetical protein|nr:hypothetical protein [Blastocatellia bacterium]
MTPGISFLYIFNYSDIHTLAILYTDPGSGALVWQLLVASFFGILFYLRAFIRRIAAMMSDRKSGPSGEEINQQAASREGSTTPNRDKL